jgi:alpha-L-rhamnosidase
MMQNNWIWLPNWRAADEEKPALAYFRREFSLEKLPQTLKIDISADSRYKLYVNGTLAELGPCKGDRQIWYYETVELAPYLQCGKNVLAVVVLRYPQGHLKGNNSVARTFTPGLYVSGASEDEIGARVCLSADASWRCTREPNVVLLPDGGLTPLYCMEDATGNAATFGWMRSDYQDDAWLCAQSIGWPILSSRSQSPGNLHARPIPSMHKIARRFQGVFALRVSDAGKAAWDKMLAGEGSVTLAPHAHEVVEIDAGELMTGFLRLALAQGKAATVKILQSEGYVLPVKADAPQAVFQKGDRLDCTNGWLQGATDTYTVAGLGCEDNAEVYEPFWFRTFRFIQLDITTAEQPLEIQSFDYQETGYPLAIKTWVKTSDPSMQAIWDISARSLRRCMHETYEDCPFYEQQQYAMDTRTEILYTYASAADDKLARRCFADFKRSQRYDGMISCCYPSEMFSVIPGFAIYYILMLHDHMMYFGDEALIRLYLPTVDGILEYFHQHRAANGLVEKIGGQLFRDEAWSFIDWTAQWDATSGMPPAGLSGSLTMESLLYLMGLQHAAELAAFVGRTGVAQEYMQRAAQLQHAIRLHCTGQNGMLQDGPGVDDYSQHCQVFAVLTGVADRQTGKENLLKTLCNKQDYAQCSVAMMYYLFRAMEQCGLYAQTDALWDIWRDMIKNHLTTCVEEPVNQRSDCHGWGALALYELPAVVLGVRPAKPGFAEVAIKPLAGPFTWAEGEVITPKGTVRVQWKKDGDSIAVQHSWV